jgi:sugar-specific transcriptional regulator TrmB
LADNLVDKLKELGLNSYEAKVYLALLRQNPATGYEISKESGVPQARAYDTLKALEANNIVVAMGGKPVTYTPISPHELLDRWERSFRGSVNYLREALPSLANETVEPIVNLRGKEALFKHALDMINNAQHSLFVQIWREDAQYLASAFQEAKKRKAWISSSTNAPTPFNRLTVCVGSSCPQMIRKGWSVRFQMRKTVSRRQSSRKTQALSF